MILLFYNHECLISIVLVYDNNNKKRLYPMHKVPLFCRVWERWLVGNLIPNFGENDSQTKTHDASLGAKGACHYTSVQPLLVYIIKENLARLLEGCVIQIIFLIGKPLTSVIFFFFFFPFYRWFFLAYIIRQPDWKRHQLKTTNWTFQIVKPWEQKN